VPVTRPPSLNTLAPRERQIMDIVLRLGRATAADVEAELPDTLTNSAVRGMLRLLVNKGFLAFETDGPRYVYFPAIPADDARRSALRHLVSTLFGNSRSTAIAALLDLHREPLSDEEYDRLAALLRKARRQKGAK